MAGRPGATARAGISRYAGRIVVWGIERGRRADEHRPPGWLDRQGAVFSYTIRRPARPRVRNRYAIIGLTFERAEQNIHITLYENHITPIPILSSVSTPAPLIRLTTR